MTAQAVKNRAIRMARNFFSARSILEVRTPKAVVSAALEPYIDALVLSGAHLSGLQLATSPEFFMKKIFAEEMQINPAARGIYEIAAVFRDDRPGKNHALEFTMVEWYLSNCSLKEILSEVQQCISWIAGHLAAPIEIPPVEVVDLQELFLICGLKLNFAEPKSFADAYKELHGELPQYLNELDLTIGCFNLLFDEFILPWLKKQKNLVAVSGYPVCLAALAYSENGVAERAEIYWRGMELANAYREEWRGDVAEERWQKYNEIRGLRGVQNHVIDEELIAALGTMKGICGVAVGLERVLAGLFPELKFLG